MRYLTIEQAVLLHDKMLDKIGGSSGYNQVAVGYLASVLENIKNDEYYQTVDDKVAYLVHSCIKFHSFNDGNKRTAILLADIFLRANGVLLDDEKFYLAMEDVVVSVARGEITKDELKEIFSKFIKDYALNHETIK